MNGGDVSDDHEVMHRARKVYRPGRLWLWDWRPWEWKLLRGSDEYGRHTYVIGPIVVATNQCCLCECGEHE